MQCCESGMIYSGSGYDSLRVPDPRESFGSNRNQIRPQLVLYVRKFVKKIPYHDHQSLLKEHCTGFSLQKRSTKIGKTLIISFFILPGSGSETNNSGFGFRKNFRIQLDPDS